MADRIGLDEGARVFGRDAALYDHARPGYPERVDEILVERCGLGEGCRTIEVGAGSGQATRRLVALGARPLVAVEPDPGFRPALERLAEESSGAVRPCFDAFESAALEAAAFDLAVCATSFHWLDRTIALRKLGDRLRPGGSIALFWNVFGDPHQPDPFHEATRDLLAYLPLSPSHSSHDAIPFALDRDARRADFVAAGADRDFVAEEIRWTLVLTSRQMRSLYATWASIARLSNGDRQDLLDRLESVAESEFGGRVERRMVTPVYTGRRVG